MFVDVKCFFQLKNFLKLSFSEAFIFTQVAEKYRPSSVDLTFDIQ